MTHGHLELVGLRQTIPKELEQQRESAAEDETEHERDRDVQGQVPGDERARRRPFDRHDPLARRSCPADEAPERVGSRSRGNQGIPGALTASRNGQQIEILDVFGRQLHARDRSWGEAGSAPSKEPLARARPGDTRARARAGCDQRLHVFPQSARPDHPRIGLSQLLRGLERRGGVSGRRPPALLDTYERRGLVALGLLDRPIPRSRDTRAGENEDEPLVPPERAVDVGRRHSAMRIASNVGGEPTRARPLIIAFDPEGYRGSSHGPLLEALPPTLPSPDPSRSAPRRTLASASGGRRR